MKLTNVYNLPKSIVRAVESHTHRSADYSVTEIMNPIRVTTLKRRYQEHITEDVSERLWALFGTAVHYIAQAGEGEQDIAEVYLEKEINGLTLSGTADLYESETRTLWDYKSTSVWSIIYNSKEKDWTEQLNSYAVMMREQGFAVDNLKILAFLKDWNRNKAKQEPSYPSLPMVVVDIKVLPHEQVEKALEARIMRLEANKNIADDDLPFCTDEERWKDPDKYAVTKRGNVRATKVFENPFDAQKHAEELGPKYEVKHRSGVPKRCLSFCPVAEWCNQIKMERSLYEDN